MDEELTRLPCCLRTGFPMFVAFSFSSGYKRLSSAMENKPYPRFYGCPHCFSRKTKQYSVRLNVSVLFRNSFALCPMTISQSFTFKQYFLNTLFFLDWYDCDREQAWKEIQRCLNRSHFRFTGDYYGPSIPLYQYPVYGTQGNPVILDLLVNGFLLDWLIDFYSSISPDFSLTL